MDYDKLDTTYWAYMYGTIYVAFVGRGTDYGLWINGRRGCR